MMLNDDKYRIKDVMKIVRSLGYVIKSHERSDGVNPMTLRLTQAVHIEFHTEPNRFRVIKEDNGLFRRSEFIRNTNDLVHALNRAEIKPTMRQYFSGKVTWEKGEDDGKLERVYTFISEDKTSGIQMRWHGTTFMKVVVLRHTNIQLPSNYDLALALIEASRSDYEVLTLK